MLPSPPEGSLKGSTNEWVIEHDTDKDRIGNVIIYHAHEDDKYDGTYYHLCVNPDWSFKDTLGSLELFKDIGCSKCGKEPPAEILQAQEELSNAQSKD